MDYELELIKKQLNEIKQLNNLLKKTLEKKGQGDLYLILETLTSLFTQVSNLKEEHNYIISNQNKIIEIILENRKFSEEIIKKLANLEEKIHNLEEKIQKLEIPKKGGGLFKK